MWDKPFSFPSNSFSNTFKHTTLCFNFSFTQSSFWANNISFRSSHEWEQDPIFIFLFSQMDIKLNWAKNGWFSNNPPHEWKLTQNTDLVIQSNGWTQHRIGRCYPLNLPLWKHIYFTSWPVDAMSLNCSAVCVNDDVLHTGFFLTHFSSHGYVHFGRGHLPGSARVSRNWASQFPLKRPHFSLT